MLLMLPMPPLLLMSPNMQHLFQSIPVYSSLFQPSIHLQADSDHRNDCGIDCITDERFGGSQLHEVASGFHKSDHMDACDRCSSVVESVTVETVVVESVDLENVVECLVESVV